MPELAEVAHYAHRWEPGLRGKVAEVRTNPDARIFRRCPGPAFEDALGGSSFREIHTHGKRILFAFSGGRWLEIGLGMSGSLSIAPPEYAQGRHDHLILQQRDRCLVFTDPRMFGHAEIHMTVGTIAPDFWRALPPQPHDKGFTKRHLNSHLDRCPRSTVKALLLDQEVCPGVGNWMADEILWRAGVLPSARNGDLGDSDRAELWKRSREVCRDAMRVIAPDWSTPPGGWLFTHRWKPGGHCPTKGCGKPLERGKVAGRTTAWCPGCQG